MKQLQPLSFPLYGSHLIEASAGTGKTHTIATLYVRLILGHGASEFGYKRALTPAKILVVTFTRAATKELRDRIRLQLQNAANFFLANNSTADDFLINLRAAYPESQWTLNSRRLQLAIQSIDQAAIFTIDSWCQRMLREHAFQIGRLFNYTINTDQNYLIKEIFYNYWRIFIATLDSKQVLQLKKLQLNEPNKFQKRVTQLIKDISLIKNAPPPAQTIAQSENSKEILAHAGHWIAEQFAQEQERRREIGFENLLIQLEAALMEKNGAHLAATIRRIYPVALIDEFQDTDPIQYRIFDQVYQISRNDPSTALILIGDPKQSIYGFRGADIHTYLEARRACQGRHYTLQKNFRSTTAMVTAINHCFFSAEHRPHGAFLFRTENDNPVPFLNASAQGLTNQLLINNTSPLPLLISLCDATTKKAYRTEMALLCAQEIARLLNCGANNAAVFSDGENLALHSRDITVLVNDRKEAEFIRNALLKYGIPSIYLSDKDSVFESPEARDLQFWLAACADPNNNRAIRAALATATLNLTLRELDNLRHNEAIWEEYLLRFRNYLDYWRRKGITPMIRALINDFNLPQQFFNQSNDGERKLTNILHLAELLHEKSYSLDGEHALINYLKEQIHAIERQAQPDFDQIRLESRTDLVKIITIHKSKGLAYPVVFFPFACNYREKIDKGDFPIKLHDKSSGRAKIEFDYDSPGKEIINSANNEQLTEALRKFYVALTRAQYAAWLTIAPLKNLELSAFGSLLGIEEKPSLEIITNKLNKWCADCPQIQLQTVSAQKNISFNENQAIPKQGSARQAQFIKREHWWIASYSALRGGTRRRISDPETLKDEIFQEDIQVTQQQITDFNTLPSGLLHDFPQGPEAGNLLHNLLEWIAHQGFSWIVNHPQALHEKIIRRCNLRAWPQWIEPLINWFDDFLVKRFPLPNVDQTSPPDFALPNLDPPDFAFADLRSYTSELEFWIAAHQVDIQKLDTLIQENTLDKLPRPALQFGQINGMLKGFIDLVFEYQGRYYVIDYKSNWLGKDNSSYNQEALRTAILNERYDLQYLLYLFALHRLLKVRLPNYHYERHIGGAIYLFLRGTTAPGQGIYFDCPQYSLIAQMDRLFSEAHS